MICPKCNSQFAERCYIIESEKFKADIREDESQCIFEYVFYLDLVFRRHLESGKIDSMLRNEFMRKKIYLTAGAEISSLDEKNWKIHDGIDLFLRVEEADDRLKVYEGEIVKKYYKLYVYECFKCGYVAERGKYVDVAV